jgi:hypothetical protein
MIRPPFSAFLIADALGVAVRYEEMEDEGYCTTRGQLVQASFQRGKRQVIAQGDKNAPVIVLRRIRTLDTAVHSRQQFTLAHELGHLVLRSLVSRHYPEYEFETDDREEEAFCNAFAGELLIPTALVLVDLRERGVSAESLLELRRIYRVSLQCMLVKVGFLFADLLVIGIHTRNGRGLELSFATPCKNRHFFDAGGILGLVERAIQGCRTQTETHEVLGDGSRSRWVVHSSPIHDGHRAMTLMVRRSLPPVLSDYFAPPSKDSGESAFCPLSDALAMWAKVGTVAWRKSPDGRRAPSWQRGRSQPPTP